MKLLILHSNILLSPLGGRVQFWCPHEIRNRIGQVSDRNLRRLVRRCVKRNPEERPTTSDVISELKGHSRSTGVLSRRRPLFA